MTPAVELDGLEDRQRDVAGSRRHVDEEHVFVVPDDVRPELLDRAGDDRAAPDDGIRLVFQKQVEADDADARPALGGDDAVVRAHQLGMDIEGLGDGRPGDIGVEYGGFIAAAAGADRQQRRDQRFAHAALAADDADDFFDVAMLVLLSAEALRAAGAIGGAGAAIVVAGFTHFPSSPKCFLFKYSPFPSVPP